MDGNGGVSDPKNVKQTLPRGVLGRSGLPMQAGTRLNTSLKAPRDLTLGGRGMTIKKSFQPNLTPNIRPSSASGSASNDDRRDSRGRGNDRGGRGRGARGRGEGRGRGRGRGAPNLIQLDGIFEAAAANKSRFEGYRQGDSGGGGGGGSSKDAPLPKYIPMVNEDSNETEETIRRLTKAEFIDFDDEAPGLPPLIIPLGSTDIVCKTEDADGDSSEPSLKLADPPEKTIEKPMQSLADVCLGRKATKEENEGSNLILFQLPTLPDPPQTQTEKAPKSAKPPSAAESSAQQPKKTSYRLNNMPRGHFGKLQILRNGSVRLRSGKVTMDLVLTPDSPFYQELVDIQKRMVVPVAKVDKKIVCKLDVEDLLSQGAKS